MIDFKKQISEGIPDILPELKPYDKSQNHAPKRKAILSKEERILAIRNALRYFDKKHHKVLAVEFAKELKEYGRIYMYRFRPDYKISARTINDYPYKSKQAAALMLMLSNNLDEAVAQHPHELITYGGNGAAFQNWAQYRLTMKYLSEMSDEQTLVLYSGHPLGLFPSHKDAPRVVVTNGMVVPNYSSKDDYERFNALGVSQYGQMTAGSFMYIGPQGIVHGTTLTILNAGRKILKAGENDLKGKILVTSGLGGMSGAQPKASVIAGCLSVTAEINPKATQKRFEQGWVDEVYEDLDKLIDRIKNARDNKEIVSIAYQGNIVDLWEKLATENINVDMGSDQTSLHNPYAGGYYPAGLSFEESNEMMSSNPELFKKKVHESLRRQVAAINKLSEKGMYFWDYGNAFLLESSRAKADVYQLTINNEQLFAEQINFKGAHENASAKLTINNDQNKEEIKTKNANRKFRYPSYVEDIMGPLFFDYGFGPFRWVCTSSKAEELAITDEIAAKAIEELIKSSPNEIINQLKDNLLWIKEAGKNKLVIGSQARILYADCIGRIKIAEAFNKAIREKKISEPIVLGRDHHDVSGTDSPYRETANIYDGSRFTADMAIQNVIGDSFRGATWVSIHNGGGVGWGEVINGGFGMVLDGSEDADRRLKSMLFWDVNNGIARRSWARNDAAIFSAREAMKTESKLKVTLPNIVDEELLEGLF